ncbi:MAG: D-aminoacylase, partial [Planctomycetota bacterium]|nr:D-aminoacylase [Planctomycetota bacterium]
MKHSQFFWMVLVVVSAGFQQSRSAVADEVDILIRNGRVVDGTGNPWFHANLAVRAGRIVAVGKLDDWTAKRSIDAKGLVVSPGFIDIHSHSDLLLLQDGHAQSKIRQGVTTEVLGEGDSAGPSSGRLSPRRLQVGDRQLEWSTLGGYFDAVEQAGVATNVVSYVGLSTVWRCVMGDAFDRPTDADLKQMEVLVDAAMRDGAIGLSSQVMMPPGSLATTDDIVRLCKVVAKYGGLYSTHIRNEGTGVLESVKEAIEIGERAGVAVDVIHLKIAEQKLWGRMPDVIALFEAARARGLNVQANVYPYTRGNNNLSSIIPPWAHEGGKAAMLRRLRDKSLRPRLKRDIRHGVKDWYNHYTAVGSDWSRMLVSGNNSLKGLTMDRVMQLRTNGKSKDVDLLDELFDILIENDGSVSTVYAHHTEADMNLALQQPWCSVGSDGSAYATTGPLRQGNPHPRNFGTFPRVLGVYVRDLKLLTLEDAVRKITSLNANKIGLRDRGQLREGFHADITIFAPERVIDRATYTAPFQYPFGIEYVIVNG